MELQEDDVHFWFTLLPETDPRIPQLSPLLSREETLRAGRFHFERDRTRYVISHGVLRKLLGQYLDLRPQDIAFKANPFGKPSLAPTCGDGSLQFNMSHTDGMAVFGVTRKRRIGVDVEPLDRKLEDRDRIVERFFSEGEWEVYRSLPVEDRVEGFFNCWTRKESYIKARGDGLTCPLDSFQVTLRPGDAARLLAVQDGRPDDWSMVSLEPRCGYKAAVTAESVWRLVDIGEYDDAA